MLAPREFATVDDRAADAGTMAADVFGQGVYDDVGAVFKRAHQCGRGDGVIHHHGYAVAVRDGADGFEINDVAQRIADGFGEHQFGFVVNQLFQRRWVAVVEKAHFDALFGQGMRE